MIDVLQWFLATTTKLLYFVLPAGTIEKQLNSQPWQFSAWMFVAAAFCIGFGAHWMSYHWRNNNVGMFLFIGALTLAFGGFTSGLTLAGAICGITGLQV